MLFQVHHDLECWIYFQHLACVLLVDVYCSGTGVNQPVSSSKHVPTTPFLVILKKAEVNMGYCIRHYNISTKHNDSLALVCFLGILYF